MTMMKSSLFYLGLLSFPVPNSASICTGPGPSPNWYGSVGYPPYFTRDGPEQCPQKYSLSRCEQSAVMKDGTANFSTDSSGTEVCTPNVDCYPTKQNCNDTLTCSDLVQLKDDLMQGGHNIVCRHEKTFWAQNPGEANTCQINGDCLGAAKKAQRDLQPFGWESAKKFATSFREMGIPIGETFSSALARCSQHADLFSDDPNEVRDELLYMSAYKEVFALNNITSVDKSDAVKWQAYNLRNFAGKKPSPGTNNVMITHGFNIKLAFGTAVDEGYCMILKPEDAEPSLADAYGSFTVAKKEFEFDEDSYPVNAIARMSPESAILMQTCDDVRADAIASKQEDNSLLSMDSNNDMKITEDEFSGSAAAFEFIRSILAPPAILGKPEADEPAIELGQFLHINWGWREYRFTDGGISYPWRSILENTVGPLGLATANDRIAAFKEANSIISSLVKVLKNEKKYPTLANMEEGLINCSKGGKIRGTLYDTVGETSLESKKSGGGPAYFPIGPGDGGAASMNGDTIFGAHLAYPAEFIPGQDVYDSRLDMVANCMGSVSPLFGGGN